MTVFYVTHPQVAVDPSIPVTAWGLDDRGRERARAMLGQPWISGIRRIVSSNETKAIETATIVADHLGVTFEVRDGLGENDRAATGFVPPAEFEVLADAFFADPEVSVRGWERAIDAQRRIVTAMDTCLSETIDGDVMIVGHGGVGTLWYCHLADVAIDRRHDQPGQGHYFAVDPTSGRPRHGWRPIDDLTPE